MGLLLSKEPPASMLGIAQSSADPPFLSKTFDAIAKKDDAKAKNGETTGMGICHNDS